MERSLSVQSPSFAKSLSTKNQIDFVLLKRAICGEQRHPFADCLGDEQTIKRIPVMFQQRVILNAAAHEKEAMALSLILQFAPFCLS